jgi:hypothetical protein
MNTKACETRHIESGIPLPQRAGQALRPDQQRALELKDGDSFLLQTIPIAKGECIVPQWRFHDASHIATRLADWARRRHVRLAYRMVDETTVRIWRLGAI